MRGSEGDVWQCRWGELVHGLRVRRVQVCCMPNTRRTGAKSCARGPGAPQTQSRGCSCRRSVDGRKSSMRSNPLKMPSSMKLANVQRIEDGIRDLGLDTLQRAFEPPLGLLFHRTISTAAHKNAQTQYISNSTPRAQRIGSGFECSRSRCIHQTGCQFSTVNILGTHRTVRSKSVGYGVTDAILINGIVIHRLG